MTHAVRTGQLDSLDICPYRLLPRTSALFGELELRLDEIEAAAYSRNPTFPTNDARFHLEYVGDEDIFVSDPPQILPMILLASFCSGAVRSRRLLIPE